MTVHSQSCELTALNWLLRLPLLGAYELSLLMDEQEDGARQLLQDLLHEGWLRAETAASPEMEPDRLYTLANTALSAVAASLGVTVSEVAARLPVGIKEAEYRWKRVEASVGVNRLIAEIVAACRERRSVAVEEALVLPLRRPRDAWWPDEADAYVCLRGGESYAPFFVAWDRTGVPLIHRKKRVAAWARFREENEVWGFDGCPPVVVLSPNASASSQWERAVLSSADRRGDVSLPCLIGEIEAAFRAGPMRRVWRRAGSAVETTLTEGLLWRPHLPTDVQLPRLQSLPDLPAQPPLPRIAARLEVVSAGSYLLGVAEKRVLDWLAFHPLLTAEDLATLIHARGHQVRAVLRNLDARGFIDHVRRSAVEGGTPEDFHFLSRDGLSFLAARDGVPVRRYARYSTAAASIPGWLGGGRFDTLLRQFEHTVGVNRFCVRLVEDVRRSGGLVACWSGVWDSAVRFEVTGTHHWLRPDGTLDVKLAGSVRRFFLEWDRGTERPGQLREKLSAYDSYFSSFSQHEPVPPTSRPRLLLVTSSTTREALIWDEVSSSMGSGLCRNLSTSLESLTLRIGPFAPVWRNGAEGERSTLC